MSAHFQTLENLFRYYLSIGVQKIYIKTLAANDNSKNQVYFGPGFEALTLFPMGEIIAVSDAKEPIFKASVDFRWIDDSGALVEAPCAQIILYPQYPETRFSGFLKGAVRSHLDSIRELMAARLPGRILFLGVDAVGGIVGSVFHPDSLIAKAFRSVADHLSMATQIFYEVVVPVYLGTSEDPKQILLKELGRIHRLGWIDSKRLDGCSNILPCNAPQCGGYTLEAELGITPNGRSEPDYLGWEIKQHSGNVLTLMTPEPTGGYYVEQGVENFVRTFGYPDRAGRPDRLNFGGTHFCNTRHLVTGLVMKLDGYDPAARKISNTGGGISLVSDTGVQAAFWAFSGILAHWNRKHRNAAYVSSDHRTVPSNQYRYGNEVLLGEGTDPLRLISALHSGRIYYDPGIKLENASSSRPTAKRRSQFRVKLRDLAALYDNFTAIRLSE